MRNLLLLWVQKDGTLIRRRWMMVCQIDSSCMAWLLTTAAVRHVCQRVPMRLSTCYTAEIYDIRYDCWAVADPDSWSSEEKLWELMLLRFDVGNDEICRVFTTREDNVQCSLLQELQRFVWATVGLECQSGQCKLTGDLDVRITDFTVQKHTHVDRHHRIRI